MNTKRITALIMALWMCLSLVPLAAVSEGGAKPAAKGGERAHENYFNHRYTGTHLNYTDTGSYDWINKYDSEGDYNYIESGCAGHAFGTSVLTLPSSVRMYAGDYLEFQYWYSTENPFDKFKFSVNDSILIEEFGESDGWKIYRYEVPADGLYNFTWAYIKDGSMDGGSDCVRLAFCTYSGHYDDYRNRAGLASGGGGLILNTPSDAEYGFLVKTSDVTGHELFLMSGNGYTANSTCKIEASAIVPSDPGGAYTVEFDYAVSSETGCDFLDFYVDSTRVLHQSGLDDYSWKHFSYNLSPGQHLFSWRYVKDGSNNQGNDAACFDNIKIVGYDNAWDRYLGFEEHGAAYSNNAQLIFNTPKGSEGFDTVTQGFLMNNNRFIDESVSYFESYITMAAGETLSFDYLVSCESYDYFRFKVDGTTKASASGWENPRIQSCTFTAPSTKTYLMRWEYEKDESLSKGYDLAIIFNILYDGTYLTDLSSSDIDIMLNHDDTDCLLHFIGGAGVGGWFAPYISSNGWDAVISANMYYENTNSSIGATCYMNAGDKLSFEYLVNGEDGCDYLEFRAQRDDGSEDYDEVDHSWWSISQGWETYTFTCETPGTYWFGWDYYKDGSVNDGDDTAMIDNVCVTRSNELMRALNPDGMDEESWIWFDSTGEFFFEPVQFAGRYCARSNNRYGNTEAVLTGGEMIGTVNGGSQISFDYYVSCEATYDYLVFFVNDVEVARFSGTSDTGWHTFTTPNKYSGWTEFKWVYHKDGNLSYGEDLAAIDNVRLGAAGLLGDVNGDGNVNANDALLLMRYALGLVPASALDLTVADVNHDGNINANDALMVMRYALGLITLS